MKRMKPILTNSELGRIAEEFWQELGPLKKFPRDIETAITMRLPAGILKLPQLTGSTVADWLRARRLLVRIPIERRPLMGCLVAYRGHGIIFVCGADKRDEQRLTIAHEAAHLLHDYLVPRNRAINLFGPSITEVLDGFRPATPSERVEAVLEGVPIGAHVHLLPRTDFGWDSEPAVLASESGADGLAMELIAPALCRRALIAKLVAQKKSMEDVCNALAIHFGVPAVAFRELVASRFKKNRPGFLEDALLTLRTGRL
jgi:hypothetical protein